MAPADGFFSYGAERLPVNRRQRRFHLLYSLHYPALRRRRAADLIVTWHGSVT
jgi:hypothetical protein